ncbi:MAG: hypothetical protein AAGE94_05340 [Acidobacteriota bacterium]
MTWSTLLLVAALWAQPAPDSAEPSTVGAFAESIDVRLVTVRLGAFDRRNQPILGLGPEDFRVTVGGEAVEVVAVDWIGSFRESTEPLDGASAGHDGVELPRLDVETGTGFADDAPPPGRSVIFFVQNDFDPSRLVGFVRLKPSYRNLVDQLDGDLGAVVVFNTHLELRQDLTRDAEQLEAVLLEAHHRHTIEFPEPGPSPSLARVLDEQAARDVASVEQALELLAHALDRLPGEKAIVMLGHGFGEMFRGRLLMSPYYERARDRLLAAKVPVFGLDVTYAGSHSQASGFAKLARETGGTYLSTTTFPEKAVRTMGDVLAGRYVLTLAGVDVEAGRHALDVRLVSRHGRLVVQPAVIRPTR